MHGILPIGCTSRSGVLEGGTDDVQHVVDGGGRLGLWYLGTLPVGGGKGEGYGSGYEE